MKRYHHCHHDDEDAGPEKKSKRLPTTPMTTWLAICSRLGNDIPKDIHRIIRRYERLPCTLLLLLQREMDSDNKGQQIVDNGQQVVDNGQQVVDNNHELLVFLKQRGIRHPFALAAYTNPMRLIRQIPEEQFVTRYLLERLWIRSRALIKHRRSG